MNHTGHTMFLLELCYQVTILWKDTSNMEGPGGYCYGLHSQGPLRMDTYLQGPPTIVIVCNLNPIEHLLEQNILSLYYLPGNILITYIGNLGLPYWLNELSSYVPLNDSVNYLKGKLVL